MADDMARAEKCTMSQHMRPPRVAHVYVCASVSAHVRVCVHVCACVCVIKEKAPCSVFSLTLELRTPYIHIFSL